MTAWEDILKLELEQKYLRAIEALESRLQADPADKQALYHLGFDYWLSLTEDERLGFQVPQLEFAARFIDLIRTYEAELIEDADFCFSFGLPLSMDYYHFAPDGGGQECLDKHREWGERLLAKASNLDPFYRRLIRSNATQEEIAERFGGRGVFASYYGIA